MIAAQQHGHEVAGSDLMHTLKRLAPQDSCADVRLIQEPEAADRLLLRHAPREMHGPPTSHREREPVTPPAGWIKRMID